MSPPAGPSRALVLSVALVSAGALGYEVLLFRLLGLRLWGPVAATVISLALLGYGASGTLLTLLQGRFLPRFGPAYATAALLFGASAPAVYAVAERVPLNPLALVWEPSQWAWFGVVYLVLSVPFLAAGTCLGLAYRGFGSRIPRLYRADLAGAAAGAAAVLGLVHLVPPAVGLRLLPAVGGLAAAWAGPRGRALAVLGIAASALWPQGWLRPVMSEYKALSQVLRAPGAAVVAQAWTPFGRLTAVRSPRVPVRYAPGLSLSCPHDVPEQVGVYLDGDWLGAALLDGGRGEEAPGYLGCLLSALPYRLVPDPDVLLLEAGPGLRVRAALGLGAARVDAVVPVPGVVEMVRGPLAGLVDDPFSDPRVGVHRGAARAFLARAPDRYDLIEAPVPDPGQGPGTAEPLLTVEGIRLALERLTPRGVLVLTGTLRLPPRAFVRLFATAVEALEGLGVERPGERLALVRTWSHASLLVAGRPLGRERVAQLRDFCRRLGFDPAWLPGLDPGEVNRVHRLQRPYLYEAARAILGPGREAFLRAYPFRVRPATDAHPGFSRTLRWSRVPALIRDRRVGGAALLEWGELLRAAALAQAVLAGAVLILWPLRRLRRGAGGPGGGPGAYFAALGVGFMLCEVALITPLTRLLGHPLYGAAVAVSGLLVAAGLGSGAAARGGPAPARAAWGAAAVLGIGAAAVPLVTAAAEGAPAALRALAGIALVVPTGFLLGMPFPLGLRTVASERPGWVPWAWGVNGFASVWGAALAGLLEAPLGTRGLLAVAAGLYLAAGCFAPRGVGRP